MYLYFVLALIASTLAAEPCRPLDATFTVTPRICFPTYNVSFGHVSDGGDTLATFLNALEPRASKECASAFSVYYCGKFYPECNADETKESCASTCSAVISACVNDTEKFTHPDLPLPTQADCDSLPTDETKCTTPPQTNLTTYYTDCAFLNPANFTSKGHPVCTPNYTIPVGEIDYAKGDDVFHTFRLLTGNYIEATGHDNPPNYMYPCLKSFANLYCSFDYPECPEDGVLPAKPICASVCEKVLQECVENTTQYFSPAAPYKLPTEAFCASFPTTGCFEPENDTNLSFFFGTDPPSEIPTPKPTSPPRKKDKYPPRGPAIGGVIGAAVIVAILAFIGVLMVVMKKQDSR